jgi:cytochrome c biogenesis protein CcmG/thiol:disulfide interchange protein DsbE
MSRSFHVHAAAVLSCALAVALAGCSSDQPAAAGPAIPFAKLGDSADRVLDGSKASFKAELAALKGHPVVVNQWASWCGPCKFEFPFMRTMAKKYAGQVAFLGVNSNDSRSSAESFLKDLPVGFPSYYDKDSSIARTFEGGRAWPTTAFYDKAGKRTNVHPGAYATQAKLQQDVERYALGTG